MKLNTSFLIQSNKYSTPFLLIDLNQVKKNYHEIRKSLKNVEVFYAMKANDDSTILKTLKEEGVSFEISSQTELESLLSLDVPVEKIMCHNPIKTPEFLKKMHNKKIKVMSFDSKLEVDKISQFAPGSELLVRINVTNEGSDWPLTKKFGVDLKDAISLLKYAKKKGLNPIGVTFHVGSQTHNPNNWVNAIKEAGVIFEEMKKDGINLNFLSLGGGHPVQHLSKIPNTKTIGVVINSALNKFFFLKGFTPRVTIEPGRGIVGSAGTMVCTVVGTAKRGDEDWAYIDAGVFNGFMETIEKFKYEIVTTSKGKRKKITIAGPSCDSVDIPFPNILLSEVKLGDRIYILNAAAYTTVYAASFNGFSIPKIHFYHG